MMRLGNSEGDREKKMKRAMIIGRPGSGKSTPARMLGTRTGLPVVHVDHIHWMPGWVERDKPGKVVLALEAQNRDVWIFEGGLGATKEHRLSRCDTLINLVFSLWLRAWRVFKRTVTHYGKSRPDLPEGCPEHFSLEFWKWIWDTRRTNREANLRWMAEAGRDVAVYHFRSARQVRAFLADVWAGLVPQTLIPQRRVMDYDNISAGDFGRSLTGVGVNLLTRDVRVLAAFLAEVFGLKIHRLSNDFAIIAHGNVVFQLHGDGTFHANPLPQLIPENPPRGGGAQFYLFGIDPDDAVAKASDHMVIEQPANKPHGLREATILSPEGYAFSPAVPHHG